MNTPPTNTPQRNLWLSIRKLRGELISYSDGDLVIGDEATSIDDANACVAVPTRPDALQLDGADDQSTFGSDELQFLIAPDELVDENGERFEPAEGAIIKLLRFGDEYRIQPTDGTVKSWRWSDSLRTWYRINAAKV